MSNSNNAISSETQLSTAEHIVVKFHDNSPQLDPQNVEQSIRQQGLGPWDELKRKFPGITISPAFAKVWDRLDDHVQLAKLRTPGYSPANFKAFYVIRFPQGTDAQGIIAELRGWSAVEYAYLAHPPLLATVNAGPNLCELPWQTFHQSAPVGIDAWYAWTVPGGDGAGQTFADIEYAAMLNHEDLVGQNITIPPGADPMQAGGTPYYQFNFGHGTSVLGIIYAADNMLDGVGIVPNAQQCYFFPSTLNGYTVNTPVVVVQALNDLQSGNVLLIEEQLFPSLGPVEMDPVWLAAIQLATAQGVIVIEPTGNGAVDLDLWVDQNGKNRLNRTSPDFVDSGAIMVGAGTAFTPHQPESFTGLGTRIDCYAWGDSIYTCGAYDPTTSPPQSCNPWDTKTPAFQITLFGGTSGASAIIAGAAIATQGMSQANNGSTLNPAALRALLSLDIYGTPSANGLATDRIGMMPDLKKIAGHFSP